jgi:hypothetical protein
MRFQREHRTTQQEIDTTIQTARAQIGPQDLQRIIEEARDHLQSIQYRVALRDLDPRSRELYGENTSREKQMLHGISHDGYSY